MNSKLPKGKQLGFKKILLGQTVVGSLTGIPVVRPNGEVVRVQLPDLPNEETDGKYGVLFLDEITTADEMQIQPALGLADDSRSLGEYTLPEHWIVIGAGNGPDCTNFVRLDDMTLSRFMAYDIEYNYFKDFRPYAHKVGIHEDIIAFLNFKPEACARVESTQMDEAGKLFPCPRTWERLSIELKMRKARGNEVDPDKMAPFAGRIIGQKAGREFGAFLAFKKNLNYDFGKIFKGTERDPEVGMASETYHIICEGLLSRLKEDLKKYPNTNDVPLEMYQKVGNVLKWVLKFHEVERQVNFVQEIKHDIPGIKELMFDEDFCEHCCPEFDEWIDEHMAILNTSYEDISNLKF
jgi:hypothetical protein